MATYGLYVVLAAGVAALYFLMPRLERSRPAAGAIFGCCALAGLLVLLAFRGLVESRGAVCFYICTVIALAAGVRVITHTRPVYSAVYFVLLVVAVAGLLVLQTAEFLAAALVIIYAGAILVTYLFVIMLAQQSQASVYDRSASEPMIALLAGFILAGAIASHASDLPGKIDGENSSNASASSPANVANAAINSANASDESIDNQSTSNTMGLGALVMTKYVVALELAALLLLISMVGAIALSRKKVPIEPYLGVRARLGLFGREAKPF